jgi:predicted ATP-dependent endonuclease of OLD family
MRISRIHITNFRNFRVLGLDLAGNAVIVGENKIGKTNLLYALRLECLIRRCRIPPASSKTTTSGTG